MTVVWQISKPVKFSRLPGTAIQEYSNQNLSFELRLHLNIAFGTFRSEDQYFYYEYEVSVLSTRTSKNVGLQTLCSCSVRKTGSRSSSSRPRHSILRSLYYSSDNQIIEMITEIKFTIMNSLIRSSEEVVGGVFGL